MDERGLEIGFGGAREGFFIKRWDRFIQDEERILRQRVGFEELGKKGIVQYIADG